MVSIIIGSSSDWGVVEKAAKQLDEFKISFEIKVLSAHRCPEELNDFVKNAESRGVKVIIAAAGMAAHLAGVIASLTIIPVIGLPISASLSGIDALLAIVQMPPGIPVATVAINGAQNAAILATQILAVNNAEIADKLKKFKEDLKSKITNANKEIEQYKFEYRK